MSPEKGKIAALMIAAVATLAVGEALIAGGMKRAGPAASAGWWAGARAALTDGRVVAGAALLGAHLALYATALATADLSLVMPLTAASYPLGTILARYFLREEVDPARWAGTAIITLGVAVVAWGEARTPPRGRPAPTAASGAAPVEPDRPAGSALNRPMARPPPREAQAASRAAGSSAIRAWSRSSRSPTVTIAASSSVARRTRNSRSTCITIPTMSTESSPSPSRISTPSSSGGIGSPWSSSR
jgi:drug/metabolite transporter (DMT)-like permease